MQADRPQRSGKDSTRIPAALAHAPDVPIGHRDHAVDRAIRGTPGPSCRSLHSGSLLAGFDALAVDQRTPGNGGGSFPSLVLDSLGELCPG